MLDQGNNLCLISLGILITVCWMMYGYYMEKVNVDHFWESKGSNFCIYFQILFQAELVALKRIRKNNIELKREVFVEMKQVCILRLLPSFWAFRWLEDERVARRLERSVIAIQSLRSTFHTTLLQSC